MANLADVASVRDVGSLVGAVALGAAIVDIGATGAPTVRSGTGFPGFGISRSGAGTYDLTFPKTPGLSFAVPFIGKSTTVFSINGTALDPSAGTQSFATANAAGAATDPASGDILVILFFGAKSAVR